MQTALRVLLSVKVIFSTEQECLETAFALLARAVLVCTKVFN